MDQINAILFNNPLCQKIISNSKKVFFKSNGTASEIQQTSKSMANSIYPNSITLYEQGGRFSSIFIRFAGLSGAAAVIFGAYGAHRNWSKDPNKPNRDPKAIFETANRYHFFHSIAILAIPLAKRPYLSGSLMASGMILFSGTCYYASLTNDERFNRLAPIGGTLLILGWISLMFF